MKRFSSRLRYFSMICAVPALMASPSAADPTVGLGLTFSFGGGGVDTGIGLRVFSDNRRDKAVGSVGVDYMFGSQRWRGTLGAAYLDRNGYIGVDLGIGLGDGAIDFGVGVGGVNTKRAPESDEPPNGNGNEVNGNGNGPTAE